jgi:hypothetical protein
VKNQNMDWTTIFLGGQGRDEMWSKMERDKNPPRLGTWGIDFGKPGLGKQTRDRIGCFRQ